MFDGGKLPTLGNQQAQLRELGPAVGQRRWQIRESYPGRGNTVVAVGRDDVGCIDKQMCDSQGCNGRGRYMEYDLICARQRRARFSVFRQ